MLDSTIWTDSDATRIFITALLMARPKQLLEEAHQIEVRTLNRTGFVVPPGWYGFIEAAGPGIVRRAGMEEEAGLAALERLGCPEMESRSSTFDGRRLVRIDGGYLALNFQKYRDKDHTAAIRARRHRKKQAARRSQKTVQAQAESRERRYVAADGNGDYALADRIAAEGLSESAQQ